MNSTLPNLIRSQRAFGFGALLLQISLLTPYTVAGQTAEPPYTLVPQDEANQVVGQLLAEASAAKARVKEVEKMLAEFCNEVSTDPKKYRECYFSVRSNSLEYLDQLTLILALLEGHGDLHRVAMKKSQGPQLIEGLMRGIPQNIVLAPEALRDEVWILEYSPQVSGARAVVDEVAAILTNSGASSSITSELTGLLFPWVKYPHPYEWNIRVFLYPSLFKVPMSELMTGSAIPIAQGASALSSYEMHTLFWSAQKGIPIRKRQPDENQAKPNPYRTNPSRQQATMALETGKATIVFQDFSEKDNDVIEIELRGEKRKVNLNEDSSFEIDLKPDESIEMKIKVLSEGSVPPCTLRVYASEYGVVTNEVVLGGKVGEVATLKIGYPTPFEGQEWDRIAPSPIAPPKPKPTPPLWWPAIQK